jgi:hypothetical protein
MNHNVGPNLLQKIVPDGRVTDVAGYEFAFLVERHGPYGIRMDLRMEVV